ncbi:MAG TPA: sigma-70 family RNA polymerase sigma factor [Longimicrobiales bacterium]|nr:sigma-70 family RNA polymerase sigma factor [Longimicrobiales bacterium]
MADPSEVTRILGQMAGGDPDAMERLLPLVYEELRELARREMRRERDGHTLGATAVVHEAYLRLAELDQISWEGRAHFFGAAAMAMRRVLISYARARNAQKRGSGAVPVPIDDVVLAARERPQELLALDEALSRLEEVNPRQARVVECRFFAGMNIDETAEALGISNATVRRDWALARAWLNRELGG